MRLNAEQIEAIREVVRSECGPTAQARLFGSRLDDGRRGGDIDVLVELDTVVDRPAVLSARLSAMLSRRLSGRTVDVLLSAPNLQQGPIHRVARKEGKLL